MVTDWYINTHPKLFSLEIPNLESGVHSKIFFQNSTKGEPGVQSLQRKILLHSVTTASIWIFERRMDYILDLQFLTKKKAYHIGYFLKKNLKSCRWSRGRLLVFYKWWFGTRVYSARRFQLPKNLDKDINIYKKETDFKARISKWTPRSYFLSGRIWKGINT